MKLRLGSVDYFLAAYACLVVVALIILGVAASRTDFSNKQRDAVDSSTVSGPPGSVENRSLGGGWYSFRFDGNRYLVAPNRQIIRTD